MKKLRFLIIFSIIGIAGMIPAWGQNDDITYHQAPNVKQNDIKKVGKKDYLERISIGGTGGLYIGYYTFIGISPNVAYHFNNLFCAGIGGSYFFYNDSHLKYSTHIFGPRVYTEAHFLKFLGAYVAYQAFNYEMEIPTIAKPRIWSNNLRLGAGYYQKAGRFAVYFYVLYNFSDRPPKENVFKEPLLFEGGFSIFLK